MLFCFLFFLCCCLTVQNQRYPSQTRTAKPPLRFGKKVFQNNANVSSVGDPQATLGTYSQAYGTVNRTELNNLLRGHQ